MRGACEQWCHIPCVTRSSLVRVSASLTPLLSAPSLSALRCPSPSLSPLQVRLQTATTVQMSMMECIRLTMKEEGFRGFYKGESTNDAGWKRSLSMGAHLARCEFAPLSPP